MIGRIALVMALLAALVPTWAAAAPEGTEWAQYRDRFITPEGRVVDTGNGGISHSEGQGYGMVLAVAADDRPTFDRLWSWADRSLRVRGDRLLSWRWEPRGQGGMGEVTDKNNASDGDLLVAWALIRAHRRWGEPAHAEAARGILSDLRRLAVDETRFGPLLLPGAEGFRRDGEVVVNPSYFVFPALEEAAAFDPEGPWGAMRGAATALIAEARFGAWRLPPEWLSVGPVLSPAQGFPAEFGFNAIRVPLNIVWGGVPRAPDLLAPFRDFWSRFDGQPIVPARVDLNTGLQSDYGLSSGGMAVLLLTRFGDDYPVAVEAMMPRLGPKDDYYAASLLLLSKLALEEIKRP